MRLFAVIILLGFVVRAATAVPEAPAAAASPTATPSPASASGTSTAPSSPSTVTEWADAHRVFEQLLPDQQKKFLDNLEAWKAMSPEEQELYRDRELFHRQKITAEIQDAMTKSGLQLDDDQREVFTLRYTQERRKIEEALRKDIDRKRQLMVADMLTRLKGEFATPPAIVTLPPDKPGDR